MKKILGCFIASLLILTACSEKTAEQVTETQTEAVTTSAAVTTEAVTTEAVTTTEAETTAEETEPEAALEEIKIGEMTMRYDAAVWETVDEYISRNNDSGDPLDDETINELNSLSGVVLIRRGDTEYILWVDTVPFDGIEGFGTKEDYELFAEALDYMQDTRGGMSEFKSEISERNGLMFVESSTLVGSTYAKTWTILKDNVQYSFILANVSRSSAKKIMNSLIDNISFE